MLHFFTVSLQLGEYCVSVRSQIGAYKRQIRKVSDDSSMLFSQQQTRIHNHSINNKLPQQTAPIVLQKTGKHTVVEKKKKRKLWYIIFKIRQKPSVLVWYYNFHSFFNFSENIVSSSTVQWKKKKIAPVPIFWCFAHLSHLKISEQTNFNVRQM